MRKQLKICCTTFLVIIFTILPVNATIKYDTVPQEFIEFMLNFYQGHEGYTYKVLNKDGLNITNQFYDATIDFFDDGDWSSLFAYRMQNVSSVLKSCLDTTKFVSRIGDIGREISMQSGGTLTGYGIVATTGLPITILKDYIVTMSARIQYDPNTFIISNATAPTCSVATMSWGDCFNIRKVDINRSKSIASNKLSATFNYSFQYFAEVSPIGIGSLKDEVAFEVASHTMTGDGDGNVSFTK